MISTNWQRCINEKVFDMKKNMLEFEEAIEYVMDLISFKFEFFKETNFSQFHRKQVVRSF